MELGYILEKRLTSLKTAIENEALSGEKKRTAMKEKEHQ